MWFCGMSLFYVWSLAFNRMCGWLTLQWYHTHSCAYMCPVEKMTFEESQCLTVFPEISYKDLVPVSWEWLASPVYCSNSDPISQLQTDSSIIILHLKPSPHSLSPCWAPTCLTAPALRLTSISVAGGAERSSPTSLWEDDVSLSLSPGLPVLSVLSLTKQPAVRGSVCVC